MGKNKIYGLKDYQNKEVNLLSSEYKTSVLSKLLSVFLVLIILAGLGFAGYYEYNVYMDNKQLEVDIDGLRSEIKKNKAVINKQKIIMSVEEQISLKEGVLLGLILTNHPIYDSLEYFESVLNGELYVSSISVDSKESFIVSASAISHEAISYTINRLKLLKYENGAKIFSDVYTNSIVRNEDEDGNVLYLFQLNCDFEGGMK